MANAKRVRKKPAKKKPRKKMTRMDAFEECLGIINDPALSREDAIGVLRALEAYKTWVLNHLLPDAKEEK